MKKILIFLFVVLSGAFLISGCNSLVKTGNVIKEFESDITLYKSESCGCCGLYSDYLKNKGKFDVNVVNAPNIASIKQQYGVPSIAESCHTTVIEDYFVEGHVPLEAINKLLEEKPDIAGIALPDMPSGSPGMPGGKNGDFTIFAVKRDGSQEVFMTV